MIYDKTITQDDFIELKELVEETLDNVQCMSDFDTTISNLERMRVILEITDDE